MLAGQDAGAAFARMADLLGDPAPTADFLRQRLKPVPAPDAKQVAKWLDELDDKRFAVRDQANMGLSTALVHAYRNTGKYPEAEKEYNRLLARAEAGNLAAQFQDIATQLQGGASPFTIAIQQGQQLGAVLANAAATGGNVFQSLGTGIPSPLNPIWRSRRRTASPPRDWPGCRRSSCHRQGRRRW